jgi:3-hydroxyisobutyrate dehydrogenase-like beta-hydroxyacid dehydrogenase
MGFGAAASLVRAGFATHGYDVVPAARERFADAGGILVDSPADLAAACDLIAVFVVNADQIEEVVFGSCLVDAAAPGTVFILSATIPPTRAEDFGRRLAAAGMLPIDAPVSGGAAKAAAGAMTIMASGPDAAFDRAGPVLDAIATRVFRLGEAPGEGSRM